MYYEKLINIIANYINCDEDEDTAEKFCDEYMDRFYSIQNDLEKEVSQYIFEVFDDINLICDSYEVNEEIREADKYCINEKVLKKRLIEYMDILNSNAKS
jgi:hypothetical protein